MAYGLTVISGHKPMITPGLLSEEEEKMKMEGREPSVQTYNGAIEEKLAPNYDDYLASKERVQ